LKKGAPGGRLFYCLLLALLAGAAAAAGDCRSGGYDARVGIRHVIDGDTVILGDGAHLRLIGIDTPEIDHDHSDGDATEPGALAARRFLAELLREGDGFGLVVGQQRRDRYGRLLGHLFLADGGNVQARILRRGHATPLTIPPNLRFLECYREAVASARRQRRGLWQLPAYVPVPAAGLDATTRGYRLVEGTVTRIGASRSSLWINLGEDFALRILRRDLEWFEGVDFQTLPGRRLQAGGRVYRRNGQLRMRLRHGADVRVLPKTEGNR
jgi:endonuclease YncB( thermonuclease family)